MLEGLETLLHTSATAGPVCSRGCGGSCFHKGYCKNGFNPSTQKNVPPPPKEASSSHQVGVRTLQLHSAAGDGQHLCGPSVSAARLTGSTLGKPLSEDMVFYAGELHWNQQLQPTTTDGWEGGEIPIAINTLEMESTGEIRKCCC